MKGRKISAGRGKLCKKEGGKEGKIKTESRGSRNDRKMVERKKEGRKKE